MLIVDGRASARNHDTPLTANACALAEAEADRQPQGNTLGDGGLMEVDVRMTLETNDAALVYVSYAGLFDGVAEGAPIRTAIRFETPAPQYQWLTRTICVGDGRFDEPNARVTYDVFELK